METGNKKRVKRREFLQHTAMAGAGISMMGQFSPAAPRGADAVPARWDEEVDVAVIGTGVAGFGAAIEAKDAGATVVMIEKEKWFGGNSLLANGSMQYPATHIQKLAGIVDKPEWGYEDVMERGEYRSVPELVKFFVENSADTALWLEKLGIVWNKVPVPQEGCRVARTLVPAPSKNYPQARGISIITVLHRAATEERKIPIKFSSKMNRIIRADSKSPILGIEVTGNGKTINIRTRKGVVLATGGFKANRRMLRALDPRIDEPFPWSGNPYVHTAGDGHFAAAAVGGGWVDMSFVCEFAIRLGSERYVVWDPPGSLSSPVALGGLPFLPAVRSRMILVDNDGNRYANEASFVISQVTWNGEHLVSYLNLPKRPRKAWMIVDATGAKTLGWTAEMFDGASPAISPFLDPKLVAWANTLSDLAVKAGIPEANLAGTLRKYNEFAAAGADKDFKHPTPFHPLETAPFFAARLVLITHDQCAGIRVNSRLQVIDQGFQAEAGTEPSVDINDERVIPHLYAAGECAGGFFGADRGPGKLGAYLVQGRFAGKHAAAEARA
jgi:urocanate reductase